METRALWAPELSWQLRAGHCALLRASSSFDLIMDFSGMQLIGGVMASEATIGGPFDIVLDTDGLEFIGYQSAGLGDLDFGRDPDVQEGLLFSVGFGSIDGLTGPDRVATILNRKYSQTFQLMISAGNWCRYEALGVRHIHTAFASDSGVWQYSDRITKEEKQ